MVSRWGLCEISILRRRRRRRNKYLVHA